MTEEHVQKVLKVRESLAAFIADCEGLPPADIQALKGDVKGKLETLRAEAVIRQAAENRRRRQRDPFGDNNVSVAERRRVARMEFIGEFLSHRKHATDAEIRAACDERSFPMTKENVTAALADLMKRRMVFSFRLVNTNFNVPYYRHVKSSEPFLAKREVTEISDLLLYQEMCSMSR